MAYKRGARDDIINRVPLATRNLEPDLNSGKPWSEMDLEDLRSAWKAGDDLEELSRYLCRDWQEIATKCKELGLDLTYQSRKRAGRDWWRKQQREADA
ncbi:MAG TPA: hypothetical protein VHT48_04460 [Methylocella sp.]|nr:hypothetical protein [Methylocella sp.]